LLGTALQKGKLGGQLCKFSELHMQSRCTGNACFSPGGSLQFRGFITPQVCQVSCIALKGYVHLPCAEVSLKCLIRENCARLALCLVVVIEIAIH
jgi:hypothetical protein